MVNLGNLATASERHIFANRALDLETLDRHNIESPRVPARLIVRNKANLQGVDARR